MGINFKKSNTSSKKSKQKRQKTTDLASQNAAMRVLLQHGINEQLDAELPVRQHFGKIDPDLDDDQMLISDEDIPEWVAQPANPQVMELLEEIKKRNPININVAYMSGDDGSARTDAISDSLLDDVVLVAMLVDSIARGYEVDYDEVIGMVNDFNEYKHQQMPDLSDDELAALQKMDSRLKKHKL